VQLASFFNSQAFQFFFSSNFLRYRIKKFSFRIKDALSEWQLINPGRFDKIGVRVTDGLYGKNSRDSPGLPQPPFFSCLVNVDRFLTNYCKG